MADETKFIFVTGGVMSGIGKGITAASVGRLLTDHGFDVTAVKIDPYLNVDAGTMNPFQHGEVYVLNDGSEVDLDLGTYERFLNRDMSSKNNITTGKVYRDVIESERSGDFLGETVQIIPHVTDNIKDRIESASNGDDVCIVELGGTVGDIEGMPFLESIRQFGLEKGDSETAYIHVTLVPRSEAGEQKTKPTQHSVKELRSIGIQPDIIIGRSSGELNEKSQRKIAMFCDVDEEAVFSNPDMDNIHQVPILFDEYGLHKRISKELNLGIETSNSSLWKETVNSKVDSQVDVLIAGKYDMDDAYYSVHESLTHAGYSNNAEVNRRWIKTEEITDENWEIINNSDAIIVPGGFGNRGFEGKVEVCRIARENDIPYLGLCLGFQAAVVEYARNVIGLEDANSTEVDEAADNPVIDLLPEQKNVEDMGSTMRLGAKEATVEKGSKLYDLYCEEEITERHRHRYEVNPDYVDTLQDDNLNFSAVDGPRMEVLELNDHTYFMASQFHPEFTSRITEPSPLFDGLVSAAIRNRNS